MSNNVAIWGLIPLESHPQDGDLKTLPVTTNFSFIDVQKEETLELSLDESGTTYLKRSHVFYESYDIINLYIKPLVSITWDTFFDDNKTPISRIRSVSFLLSNGDWSEAVEKTEPIRKPELYLRKMRGRVVEELIDIADRSNLGDKIRLLYTAFSQEIYIYKESGNSNFRDAIKNLEQDWLDVVNPDTRDSPRDVLINYLSIGLIND